MKSYIKLLSLGALLAGTTACSDLDVDLENQYTEFPDNPIATVGKYKACYNYFQEILCRDYKEMVVFSSDEFTLVSFGGDYTEARYLRGYLHDAKPDLEWSKSVFNAMQSGIVSCNNMITEVDGPDATVHSPAVAPLRAARAFYHFILMDCYGDVPILTKNAKEGEAVDRMPRKQVAEFIESELLDIMDDITEEVSINTYATPNKWMAKALLAKLYLNWGVYTNDITTVTNDTPNPKLNDCVKVCDDIIKSGLFEVGTGYRYKFFPDNKMNNKDFIYSTNYTADNGHDWTRYFQFRQNKNDDMSYWGFKLTQSCGGNARVSPEFVDLMEALPGDERAEVLLGGPVYLFNPKTYERTDVPFIYKNEQVVMKKEIVLETVNADMNVGKNIKGWTSGYECVKYPINEIFNTHGRRQTNNIPIFRYADILLTKAECILRGATATEGATVAGLVDEVRDCSGAPHVSGTFTLQDLLDERGREFFAELWRRNDLIRYGQYEKERPLIKDVNPSSLTDKTKRLFPIGTEVMNSNTNWTQNPGY